MITLSSDLYYANLGVNNPQQVQRMVNQRLREFREYLDRARRRLKNKKYSFSYSIASILVSLIIDPQNETGKRVNLYEKELFLDKQGKKRINQKSVSVKQKDIFLNSETEDRQIYARIEGELVPFRYSIKKVILENIQPSGVEESEEEEVLDLLFESREVYENEEDAQTNRNGITFDKKLQKKRRGRLDKLPTGNQIWINYNTSILWRQQQAIEELATRPKPHHIPLLNLFQKWDFIDDRWGVVEEAELTHDYFVLKDAERDGSEEQRRFVKIAMGTPDFAFLEGPPGSGKTTTLLELISQTVNSEKRVLMVASTHVAVDNILERLEEIILDSNGNEKSLVDACGAIPLRIGDKDRVSPKIRKYCLDQRVETELKRLKSELEKVEKRSPERQKFYRQIIKADADSKKIIENLLLESSNLICGTTIGVLQAPMIKNSGSTEPLFDLVILDEASKTTFQEFLVPALYGKRWILSGDVKQLSPYVDRSPIIENLKNISSLHGKEGKEDREICLSVFKASSSTGTILIPRNESDISEYASFIEKQVKNIELLCTSKGKRCREIAFKSVSEKPVSLEDKLEIFSSNLLVVPRPIFREIDPFLPPDLETDEFISAGYQRRRAAYIRPEDLKKWTKKDEEKWEEAIEWRISRLHEVKEIPEKYEQLQFDIEKLLPYYDRKENSARPRNEVVAGEIGKIRRISLPSVIELLQKGFELDQANSMIRDPESIALYSGLSYGNAHPEILESRRILFTYQHRMHPAISKFPRIQVYDEKALNDAKEMEKRRLWEYTRYASRSVWIDIQPGRNETETGSSKYNLAEINSMVRELRRFMNWAKDHPNKNSQNKMWSVALLSFYMGQVKKLSDALQDQTLIREFGLKGSFNDFSSRQCNTDIKISSVDRFQGHEADIVFLSFVWPYDRSHPHDRFRKRSRIGFLDNVNRLNVAITRARYQLVMFGDRENFKNSRSKVLEALAEEADNGLINYGGK